MAPYDYDQEGAPAEDSPDKKELVGRLVDIFKRAISTGAGVIFSPPDAEGKRGALELPKEVIQFLLGAADNLQESILRIIGAEIRKFLERLDIGGELQKILTSTSFEIKTEIRFIPNDQAVVSPKIKAKVRAKRQHEDKEVVVEEDL